MAIFRWASGLFTFCASLDLSEEAFQPLDHEVHHLRRQARIDADKKRVPHDPVRLGELAEEPVLHPRIARLAQDVAAENRSSLYPGRLQPLDQLPLRYAILHRDRKTEPGRLSPGIAPR